MLSKHMDWFEEFPELLSTIYAANESSMKSQWLKTIMYLVEG